MRSLLLRLLPATEADTFHQVRRLVSRDSALRSDRGLISSFCFGLASAVESFNSQALPPTAVVLTTPPARRQCRPQRTLRGRIKRRQPDRHRRPSTLTHRRPIQQEQQQRRLTGGPPSKITSCPSCRACLPFLRLPHHPRRSPRRRPYRYRSSPLSRDQGRRLRPRRSWASCSCSR